MIGTYHGVRVWCNLDGCGILCVLATWSMMLFAVYVVTFVLLRPTPLEECLSASRVLTSLAFAALAGLAATAHVRTMLTDPGAVPRHAEPLPDPSDVGDGCDEERGGAGAYAATTGVSPPDDEGDEHEDDSETSRLTTTTAAVATWSSGGGRGGDPAADRVLPPERGGAGGGGAAGREGVVPTSSGQRRGREEAAAAASGEERQERVVKWCYKCDAFKPPRAHHCSLCQRCIVKMDHHCPWVNNCVGIANQKLFLLFCAYTCALCVFALTIELVVVVIIGPDRQVEACRLSPGDHAATVALAAMSMMFGLFTCCMACDQCQVASTNQTKIDRLKGEVHDSVDGANEVFGGVDGQKCRCHWLMPSPARFPAGEAAARIFGYCTGAGAGGSRSRGGGRNSDGGGIGQEQALVGGPGAGLGDDRGDTDMSEMELGQHMGVAVPNSRGGGGRSAEYAVPEAEMGLRRSAQESVADRVEAMSETSVGSAGKFR